MLEADDAARALVAFARANAVTQIFLPRPPRRLLPAPQPTPRDDAGRGPRARHAGDDRGGAEAHGRRRSGPTLTGPAIRFRFSSAWTMIRLSGVEPRDGSASSLRERCSIGCFWDRDTDSLLRRERRCGRLGGGRSFSPSPAWAPAGQPALRPATSRGEREACMRSVPLRVLVSALALACVAGWPRTSTRPGRASRAHGGGSRRGGSRRPRMPGHGHRAGHERGRRRDHGPGGRLQRPLPAAGLLPHLRRGLGLPAVGARGRAARHR